MALVALMLGVWLQTAHAQRPGGGRPFGGPPGMERTNLVARFDADGDGRLDDDERAEARAYARELAAERPRFPFGGGEAGGEPATVPRRLTTLDEDIEESARVAVDAAAGLYDPGVVRTLFLRLVPDDWYDELRDLYHTEVDVPAALVVDGRTYADVGVRFRGNSSYFATGESLKKSWNLSLDWADDDQRLYGYRTLNLLNSHTDPSFAREAMFSEIGRDYTPAPRVNHVRLVVNGDDWGVYVNVQQFNSDYVRDAFGETGGDRWKVPSNPRSADGGLSWLGHDVAAYRAVYQIKSKDDDEAWAALVKLCQVLRNAPDDELEAALVDLFDVDGALWHLAMENVFIDHDGYMSRASDYNLYRDEAGRFHLVPHDSNETFRHGGRGGGPGSLGETQQVDPFLHADNPERPVIHRLLSIPHLRARYAAHVRTIVDEWLTWERIGPRVDAMQALIDRHVKADEKQLYSYEDFARSTTDEFVEPRPGGGFGPPPGFGGPGASGPPPGPPPSEAGEGDATGGVADGPTPRRGPPGGRGRGRRGRGGPGGFGRPSTPGLKPWVEARREYLLSVEEIARPAPVADVTRVYEAVAGRPTPVHATTTGVRAASAVVYHAPAPRGRYAHVAMRRDGVVWSAEIPAYPPEAVVYYYVELRGENGATAFAPVRAEAAPWSYRVSAPPSRIGAVVINEFMAANDTAFADPQGDFDDWIELYNTTEKPVDLSGHFLSDDASEPRKWAFPAGTVIGAGAYLVVWADNDDGDPGVHASFKLAAKGEAIVLSAFDGADVKTVDRVDFGAQATDTSAGRRPDRDGGAWPMRPSPGLPNNVD